jgi:Holliday junction resolvase-like predicted endonuclease
MAKKSRTEKQIIGEIGEKTACKFLVKQGFEIVERNYRKKWGEIDIIAEKEEILHFVEVKTVSRENLKEGRGEFSPETPDLARNKGKNDQSNNQNNDCFRPEDNIHPWKLKRLGRAIQSYLGEKAVSESKKWQFDAITVLLNIKDKLAKVKFLEDLGI